MLFLHSRVLRMRMVHLYTLFFRLAVGFLHPESWWRGLENLCGCRLIIIKHSGVVLYTAKWCMVEHTILASTLCMFPSLSFPSLAKTSAKAALWAKVMLIIKNKGMYGEHTPVATKFKKHRFADARTGLWGEANIRSSLAFIKEMHSIAISGRHILPLTYRLIALLLHKGKMDSCIFDALYFFN